MCFKKNMITSKNLEQIQKYRQEYYCKTFSVLNGHNIESYVKKYVLKQLKKKDKNVKVKHPYNKDYDLILYYKKSKYTIEVKSAKRYLKMKNGYVRNGIFKIGLKAFYNKPDIFVFCIYYRKFREIFFVFGFDVLRYLNIKNKKNYYSVSIKQMKENLKPKLKIIDIITKVNENG